jgi:hypothetical protein
MSKNGMSEMIFEMPIEFINEFGFKSIKFEKHSELDEFVHVLRNKFPKFKTTNYNEYIVNIFFKHLKLLKSFDRAFWLRNYSHEGKEENSDYLPSMEVRCYFKNPKHTKSIGGNNWLL